MDTMNPTLINGFEDIIVFIRNQEKTIKKLREENKELKLEDDQMEDTLSSLNFYKEANQELKQEIKEYEFESCESLAKDQRLYGQIFHLEKENIKMKKEVNDMTGMFNFVVKKEEEKVKRIQELEEELLELKESQS